MAVVIDRTLNCKVNDTITVWGIFDAHVDNRWSESGRLQRDIDAILADPLARCVIGGDFNDMIFHGDPRFTPSGLRDFLSRRDDVADAVVEYNCKLLKPLVDADKIDVYLTGNHECNFEKRHKTNVARRTAIELGLPYGGYMCGLRYYLKPNGKGGITPVEGLLHHGHGGASEVTGGAIQLDRALSKATYDFFMMGHIHTKTFRESVTLRMVGQPGHGRFVEYPRCGAVCGTYLKSFPDTPEITYSEMKFYKAAPLGAGRTYIDLLSNKDGYYAHARIN